MSLLLSSEFCAKCGVRLELGDKVLRVDKVTHRGMVHTEIYPTREVVHVKCPEEYTGK